MPILILVWDIKWSERVQSPHQSDLSMCRFPFGAGLTEESTPLVVSKISNSFSPTRLQSRALIANSFAARHATSQYWQSCGWYLTPDHPKLCRGLEGSEIQPHLSVWVFPLGLVSGLLTASDFTLSPRQRQVDSYHQLDRFVAICYPSTSHRGRIFCSGSSTRLCLFPVCSWDIFELPRSCSLRR